MTIKEDPETTPSHHSPFLSQRKTWPLLRVYSRLKGESRAMVNCNLWGLQSIPETFDSSVRVSVEIAAGTAEARLEESYELRTGRSRHLYERAKKVFAGGVNHNARFYEPYPIYFKTAKNQCIWDEDGNRYTDYWMGHMALILGHSPKIVIDVLRRQIAAGTHFGMGSELSIQLGEEIQKSVPCAEKIRFCNTGAEATMYLVRLARAFTGKRVVVKMAGGWHGYNTELNKGVHVPFDRAESAGILKEEQAHVRNVRFNDLAEAEAELNRARGDVAAIFLEPVLGAGGCIPAKADYIRGLRELADRHAVLLCFDEIITGFRLAVGGAQEWYGITPDLAAFGKIAGGGLPIGLVCGRQEILSLADPSRKSARFVSIGGGTFSENPLTMVAGLETVRHLRKKAASIYPRLDALGREARANVDGAFAEAGIQTHTTGAGSLFMTHFGKEPKNAEEAAPEDKKTLMDYALYLMASGSFVLPGHLGGISTAHTREDIRRLVRQSGEYAENLRHKHE